MTIDFTFTEIPLDEKDTIALLKKISHKLRRPFRPPRGNRLERFCTYFGQFPEDRRNSFVDRIGKTVAASDPSFKLDDIVADDMINSIASGTKGKKTKPTSFYDIQVLEV